VTHIHTGRDFRAQSGIAAVERRALFANTRTGASESVPIGHPLTDIHEVRSTSISIERTRTLRGMSGWPRTSERYPRQMSALRRTEFLASAKAARAC